VIHCAGRTTSVEELALDARSDCEVGVVFLDRGPVCVESQYDQVLAGPDTAVKAWEAQRDGFDAVVISCMLDPGLAAARELVTIPVIGPCQASMHLAAMLGHRFSIVTVLERLIPAFESLACLYGVDRQLASVRSVDIPVLEINSSSGRMMEALLEQSTLAIEEDNAHVLVLGCTGMRSFVQSLRNELREAGYDVPVIDPGITALKVAEGLVGLGQAHSKRTYPRPVNNLPVGFTRDQEPPQ
jgi:allantoin racemase